MEEELINTKPKLRRVKKTPVTASIPEPNRMAIKIHLRPIKWAHLGYLKPFPNDLVAVKFKLHTGVEFVTTLIVQEESTKLEADSMVYYKDAVGQPGYFQLSFYASNQNNSDFELMTILGERGEILYLYEF